MIEAVQMTGVLEGAVGTALALFSAGIVWLLKSAIQKHRSETLALARLSRVFATNLTLLKDNFDFLDEWTAAASINRPYRCRFRDYLFDDEEVHKIGNLDLVNRVIPLNYMLKSVGLDFDNAYRSYWSELEKIDAIENFSMKEENLIALHKNMHANLVTLKSNYIPLKNSVIEVLALLRVVGNVRFHSLFGYLGFLFRDFYPRATQNALDKQISLVREEFKKVEQGIKTPPIGSE